MAQNQRQTSGAPISNIFWTVNVSTPELREDNTTFSDNLYRQGTVQDTQIVAAPLPVSDPERDVLLDDIALPDNYQSDEYTEQDAIRDEEDEQPVSPVPAPERRRAQRRRETGVRADGSRANIYVRVTPNQRARLTEMFNEGGGQVDLDQAERETRICRRRLKELLRDLTTKGTIELSRVLKGRKKVITPAIAQLIRERREQNPRIDLRSISNIVEQETNIRIPHTTIYNNMRNGLIFPNGITIRFVFKLPSVRGPNANSIENKELRKERLAELKACQRQGCLPTYVDETAFVRRKMKRRVWAESGTPEFDYSHGTSVTASCVTFISDAYGAECCIAHDGTIDASTFLAAMKTFYSCCQKRKRVFVMDNAPVHDREEICRLAAENEDSVVFNAPYSPDTNPIENVFGMWKTRVNAINETWRTWKDLSEGLNSSFQSITPEDVSATIAHLTQVIWPKVESMCDL